MAHNRNLQASMESYRADREGHEEQALERMHAHQTCHATSKISRYVCKGAKLACLFGTKPAQLDAPLDHGVYVGTSPLMTCMDCKEENLHHFGSCMCPEGSYMGRLPLQPASHPDGEAAEQAPYNRLPHICKPMVNTQKGWCQADTGTYVGEAGGSADQALLEEAFLVCQYGGIITITEVPDQQEDNGDEEKEICVCCSRAVDGAEPATMKNGENFAGSDGKYAFKQTDIAFEACFGGCLSKKCAGEECTAITDKQDQGDIEDGIWQEYDDVYRKNKKDSVSSANTYMICKKGGGFIYFPGAKQELLDLAEQLKEIDIYVTGNQLRLLKWKNLTMNTVVELNRILNKYEINTVERIRHFLAQCMKETDRGLAVREGGYIQWKSQEGYENYYNTKTQYGYKYRGAGYIQLTHDYHYFAFAAFLIKQEYPELGIKYRSPKNTDKKTLQALYDTAVQKAENAGYNIDEYKKIVDEGADYVAQKYAWEAAGYFWKAGDVNAIVDGLTPGEKQGADNVTKIVNRYTDSKSYEDRRNYYEETKSVIK